MRTWCPPASWPSIARKSVVIHLPLESRGDFMKKLLSAAFIIVTLCSVVRAQVTKDTVPGITNLSRVETTVACAGAVTPSAVAEIKKMGFVSIINLRQPTEQGADIDAEAAAAKTAGINFFNI